MRDLVSGRFDPGAAVKQHGRQALEGGVANVSIGLGIHFVDHQTGRVQHFLALFPTALLVGHCNEIQFLKSRSTFTLLSDFISMNFICSKSELLSRQMAQV